MYCPKCGQQQISDEQRFCSRCGLRISGLAEWVASGGGLLAVRHEEAASGSASQRRKGIRRGGKLMFLSCVLLPIFFSLSILADSPGPLLVPLVIFLAGLSLMLYARIFSDEIPRAESRPAGRAGLKARSGGDALPPASNIGMIGVAGQQVRTAELAHPPSVVEHTTKLLDRD